MNGSGDLWYVKLPDGEVHRVTLDQLDEAFQGGHIDENTMVLAAGGTRWMKLADAAGLDDAAPTPAVAPVAAAPVAQPRPAVVTAPMTAAVPVRAPYVAPAPVPNPNSLRPVSMDLGDAGDLDLDMPFHKKSGGGKRWVIGGLAVALLAAGGVGAARPDLRAQLLGGGGGSTAAAAVVTPPPAAMPPPETSPAPPPPPAAATPPVAAAPGGDSPLTPRFTDSTRQKLLDADKQRDQRSKARAAAHPSSGSSPSQGTSRSKSPVFTTGGNKFDPLNSSI
ncbi:MAG TPA: hypothetical protein VKU41_09235 [Polyangiaceae bacterium]|nr:hypothetical protein [Polyangiaceae bacterium]